MLVNDVLNPVCHCQINIFLYILYCTNVFLLFSAGATEGKCGSRAGKIECRKIATPCGSGQAAARS